MLQASKVNIAPQTKNAIPAPSHRHQSVTQSISSPVPADKTVINSGKLNTKNNQTASDSFLSPIPVTTKVTSGPSAEIEKKDTLSVIKSIPLPDTLTTANQTNFSNSDTLIPDKKAPLPDSVVHQQEKYRKPLNISVGISYSPEWMFNILDKGKYVNNLGLEGSFHFGPYSIRTGAGLSVTRGSNEIRVETNPYLGNFQLLDSITFQWDTQHYHLIPSVFTTTTDVFDTLKEYKYSYINKRYTYLQIPLILGYDVLEKEGFSLGFRAGAVMSILLGTKTLTESFDPGKDRIIMINNITPERIQLNWQAIGGINVTFRMSKRIKFEIEPQVRYYFNSVYEKAEISKMPWSAGCRAAVSIDF